MELDGLLRRVRESKELAYDSETSGLDWRTNHVVGHVLTFSEDPRDSHYVSVRHAGGGNTLKGVPTPQTADGWGGEVHPWEADLMKALRGRTIMGHNLAFDLRFMHRLGFDSRDTRFEDSMINEPLLNEYATFSLFACSKRHGVQVKKGDELYEHIRASFPEECKRLKGSRVMAHYWRLAGDDTLGVDYAKGDGTSTWQLVKAQMPLIEREELGLVQNIESRLIPVLHRMSMKGIKIDMDRLLEVESIASKRLEMAMDKLPKDFALKSVASIRPFLESHGITDWPTTPARGLPSFTEDWLKTHEPGRLIITARKMDHLLSSFLHPLMEKHVWNGRVHCTFNQLRNDEFGTITGRLSCSDPNLQQIHKRNVELGRLIRSIFIPDDGMIWGSVDYSQCEPRLLAYYSRCKVLMDGYLANPPVDAHTAVTKAINRDRWDNMDEDAQKQARERGKRVNQTIITGGGAGALESRYAVKNAREVMAEYFAAMPEVKAIQKRAGARMKNRGYVMSLLKRRARLKSIDKSYVALNRLLQCGNADIIKLKMVEVDDYLQAEKVEDCSMMLNIHDAIEYGFTEEARPHYENCLQIMESFGPDDVIPLDIPMPVDPGEGPNWAIATYGEEKEDV